MSVSINGVSSQCTGNCDFQWLESSTPIVTNIDISNPQSIILTGSGFGTSVQNNKITLGDVECMVTSASSTQLICKPG